MDSFTILVQFLIRKDNSMNFKTLIVALFCLFITQCGSSSTSSSSSSGTLSTTEQSQSVAFLSSTFNSMASGINYGSSSTNSDTNFLVASVDCSTLGGSGSLDIDTDAGTLSYDECEYTLNDINYSYDGTISFSSSGGTLTITTNLSVSQINATTSAVIFSFTQSGSMTSSISGSTATVEFDSYSSTFTDGSTETSLAADGTIAYDTSASTVDGDLTLTVDSTTITCSFSSFNYSTATSAQWASACNFS